jgi:streptothricin acetyltransferase
MTIKFRTLERLSIPDLKRISGGYTTTQKYAVSKVETHEQTTITLELIELAEPYHKDFPYQAELLGYYRSAIKRGLSLGAYDDEALIGIAIADRQDWNRTMLLWEFHIAPDHQGRGIGRAMMERLAVNCKAAGMRIITVETSNINVPAIQFYRRVGFNIEAIDLTFYSNDDLAHGDVAVFMKRKLE